MKIFLKFLFILSVVCAIPTKAALSPESQILLDNENAGISYMVPDNYSNMGNFDGDQKYTLLYGQNDFDDSFPHEFRVYTISSPETVNKFKNIKTNTQAETLFSKIIPASSGEKMLSTSIKTIGTEKFIIVDMLRSNSEKTLHMQVAHLYKNNKLYVIEFLDNTESYLKFSPIFDSFLRSFKVKDFSKNNKPVVGKLMTLKGTASVFTYNIPETYSVKFSEPITDLSNARNQSITISQTNDYQDIQDIFSANSNASLVEIMKKRSEFAELRMEQGAGNNYLSNAYIKTYGGQKMFIVDYDVKFVGVSVSDYKAKTVYMYKNGTVYLINFIDLDTYVDSEVEELLKSIKIKDTKKVPVISKSVPVVKPVVKKVAVSPTINVPKITNQITLSNPMTVSFNIPTGFISHASDGLVTQSTLQEFINIWSSNQGSIRGIVILETSFSGIKNIFNAQNDSELFAIVDSQTKRDSAEMISYNPTVYVNSVDKAYISKYNNNIYYMYELTSKPNQGSSSLDKPYKQVFAYTKVNGNIVSIHLMSTENNSTAAIYEFLKTLEFK